VPAHEQVWGALDDRQGELTGEMAELEDKVRVAGNPRERLHHKHRLEPVQRDHAAGRAVQEALCRATSIIDRLLICPVCTASSLPGNFEEADGIFRCRCMECDTSWGLRACSGCGARVPFIDFAGNRPSASLLDVDRRCGCDVLAIPLAEGVFLCPGCGHQTDGEKRDG